MKGKWIFVIFVLAVMAGSAMGSTEIRGNYRETGVVDDGWFEAYHINVTEPGKVIDIKVTASDNVDFYLFTEKEYDDYLSPSALSFHYEEKSENAKSFEWRGSGDYYLVIDNMNLTESGAMSHGDVNYTIVATLQEKSIYDNIMDNLGYMVCGTLIIVAIATSSWLYKKPKIEEVLK